MKTLFKFSLVLCFVFFCGCARQEPEPGHSVIKVETFFPPQISQGSGFLIDYKESRYLVSAAHLFIKGPFLSRILRLTYPDQTQETYYVTEACFAQDVVVLKVQGNFHCRSFSPNETLPAEGEICFAYGFARGRLCRNKGPIRGTKKVEFKKGTPWSFIAVETRVFGGMSGGPMLYNGKVIGVISAQTRVDSYSTPISIAMSLIRSEEFGKALGDENSSLKRARPKAYLHPRLRKNTNNSRATPPCHQEKSP